jgi:capsid protein
MAADDKPALLISDAEREHGITLLRDAVVDGRLTLEEFSERVGSAQVVRTEPELAALLADLLAQAREVAVQVTASHRAVCSRLVRQGLWELPERSLASRAADCSPAR